MSIRLCTFNEIDFDSRQLDQTNSHVHILYLQIVLDHGERLEVEIPQVTNIHTLLSMLTNIMKKGEATSSS